MLRRILAVNVKNRRIALSYTQKDLALICRISSKYIGKIESEKANPSFRILESLAEALECTPLDLLTLQKKPKNEEDEEDKEQKTNCSTHSS